MFTGLVEEMGTVISAEAVGDGFELSIGCQDVLSDAKFGDSICVSGVCLSLMRFDTDQFTVGLAPETLRLTRLGDLKAGDRVNLERSLLPTTRLGGHYVQGHVDDVATILDKVADGDAINIAFQVDPVLMKYIVKKGYVCVDGTSLTVVDTGPDWFSLTLISHSQPLVTLGNMRAGDRVNIEVDIMAKFAEKILEGREVQ